jgi:hypothetical protein
MENLAWIMRQLSLIIVQKDNTYEDARKIETLERIFIKTLTFNWRC